MAILDCSARPVTPLAFSTIAVEEVRQELLRTSARWIDFFGMHMESVESILGARRPSGGCMGWGTSSAITRGWLRLSMRSNTMTARACERWTRQMDLGGPIALRQDTNDDVSGLAAWHLRRQLPAGR